MSILSFKDLSYSYNQKNTVLKGLSAELELGKIYAILGSSGCGKTTLLSLLGGLDKGYHLFSWRRYCEERTCLPQAQSCGLYFSGI